MSRPKKPDIPTALASARKFDDAENAAEAFRLKRNGASYDEIAEALGISEQAAMTLIHERLKVLAERLITDGKQILAEQLERIDRQYRHANARGFGGYALDYETGEPLIDEETGKRRTWEPDFRYAVEARKLLELQMKLLGQDVKHVRVDVNTNGNGASVVPSDPLKLALLEHALGHSAGALPAKGETSGGGVVDAEFAPVVAASVVEEPDDK